MGIRLADEGCHATPKALTLSPPMNSPRWDRHSQVESSTERMAGQRMMRRSRTKICRNPYKRKSLLFVDPYLSFILLILNILDYGAGRGGRTPMTLRSADFESAASASSTIPARGADRSILHGIRKKSSSSTLRQRNWRPFVGLHRPAGANRAFQIPQIRVPGSDEQDFTC